jgi:outer membrane protein assembly factor BamE (lipoprotein component of BamABCDE complex)
MRKGYLVLLAAPLLAVVWFVYTIRWSSQARSAAANLARARNLRIGMSTDQVRHVMGRSGDIWKGARVPPVWYYPTPFMSDGTVTVYFNPDSTVQNILFPTGEHPSQRREP